MADWKVVSFLPLLFIAHLVLPGVSAEECAPVNHDISVLKKRQYWQFERPAVKGCVPLTLKDANSSTCIFYFSICSPVPRYCPEKSGICLANKITFYEGNTTSILYSPFVNTGSSSDEKFTSGPNHFILNFGRGESMGPVSLFPPVTQLRFQCDKNATWENSLDGKVDQYLVNITYGSNPLEIQYNIVFNYSRACKHGGGGGGGGGGDDGGPSDVLSVGSILLILFFPGMFLYCVVGALINKGAGKTGKDMIPNSKFWSDLPGLISDGISFVVAKITCSQMSTSQESYDRM